MSRTIPEPTTASMSLVPSDEQRLVVEAVKASNVIVNSVAGSGKTTTVMFIARAYPKANILLLTYNTILAKETNMRLAQEQITNVSVFTYHAFAGRFYGQRCANDKDMGMIIEQRRDPNRYMPLQPHPVSIMILDEVQDMTPTYYEFITLHVRDYPAKRYCIVGDVNQNIYEFNRADSRFLSYADKLFNYNDLPFRQCKLSTSYRVTEEIAAFINRVYLRNNRIRAVKSGPPVNYIVMNNYDAANFYKQYIREIFTIYTPNDVFILAPSIREKSPVLALANYMSATEKIRIYVPNSDSDPFDEDAARDKVAFSSFHQSKGRERKCVIVFGADASYIKYYTKGVVPSRCPNSIYVALTRAKELLVILHSKDYDFMPFCNPFAIPETAVCIKTVPFIRIKEATPAPPKIPSSVTGLLRHHPSDVMANCDALTGWVSSTGPDDGIGVIQTSNKIHVDGYVELVGDVVGTAIVLYHEFITRGTCAVLKHYITGKQAFVFNTGANPLHEILRLAIHHNSVMSGYNYKKFQVSNFEWAKLSVFTEASTRLSNILSAPQTEFETPVQYTEGSTTIFGSVDVVDRINKVVYEIKFVDELQDAHRLQLAVYAAMLIQQNPEYREYTYRLYNVRCNTIHTIDVDNVTKILSNLIASKLTVSHLPIDSDFLDMITAIRGKCDLEVDPITDSVPGEEPDTAPDEGDTEQKIDITDMLDSMDLSDMC